MAIGRTNSCVGSNGTKVVFENAGKRVEPLQKRATTSLNGKKFGVSGASVGDYALFAGGYGSGATDTVEAYTTNLQKKSATPLSSKRYNIGTTSIGGYALFAGGVDGSGTPPSNVDAYTATLQLKSAPPLSYVRNRIKGTTVGEYALFVTSNVISVYTAELQIKNMITLSSRTGITTATAGDYAIFAGGKNSNFVDVAEAISSELQIKGAAPLIEARSFMSATSVGDCALFAGGWVNYMNSWDTGSSKVDIYASTLQKKGVDYLSTFKGDLAAATVGDYAFFGGGYDQAPSYHYNDTVDVFNASLQKTKLESLSAPRAELAATSVGDYVLFAGGRNKEVVFDTVEAFNGEAQYILEIQPLNNIPEEYEYDFGKGLVKETEPLVLTQREQFNGYVKYKSNIKSI